MAEAVPIDIATIPLSFLYFSFQQTEYKLNLRTRNCTVHLLTRPFFELAIPPNAHFDFEAEIGVTGSADHLNLREWDDRFGNGKSRF